MPTINSVTEHKNIERADAESSARYAAGDSLREYSSGMRAGDISLVLGVDFIFSLFFFVDYGPISVGAFNF